jgi:hypothetical protein
LSTSVEPDPPDCEPLVPLVAPAWVAGSLPPAASTVHVKLAGVASTLPAPSVARTSNVCVP